MKTPYLAILFFLLIFICCNRQSEKNDDKFKTEMRQLINDFNNRPIYKVLTSEIIDSIPDDNLVLAIYDNLSEKCPKDYDKEYTAVMSWNEPRQAVFIIWWLEAEVNNGGFDQYYFNTSGLYYKQLPEALRSIGAVEFANLAQRANLFYEQNQEIYTKQSISEEEFLKIYENSPLDKYDDEFYSLYEKENLYQLLVNFIRKNKADFIDK